MKKKNNYSARARLVRYDPNKKFYLSKWAGEKWEENGAGKNIRGLLPLIDGNRHEFYLSLEVREMILNNSTSKKISRLVGKLPVIC